MSEVLGSEPLRQNDDWSPEASWPSIRRAGAQSLQFYTNSSPVSINPRFKNFYLNMFAEEKYHVELGVLEAPEIPATDIAGDELSHDIALYVDSRLGVEKIYELDTWIQENTAYFEPLSAVAASPEDIRAAVDLGLAATGLDAELAHLKEQDKAESLGRSGLDLTELMRTMRGRL